MRLRKTGRAMGYTLSHIHDDDGRMVGATMFFKDLTRVEQMEERDRLRDRLAALGEMAAAIAHEVKNPLASIEVMAGVLKRQLHDREDALDILTDIIKEAKMANAIVVEVLEFVRPIQLQVERADLNEVLKDSITLAEGKMRRGSVSINTSIETDVPELLADPHQLRQLFSNLLANAFEALGGEGHVDIRALPAARRRGIPRRRSAAAAGRRGSARQRARHRAGGSRTHFQPVLQHEAAGHRPGPGHCAQRRGRPRRTYRRLVGARPRHDLQSHAAGGAI